MTSEQGKPLKQAMGEVMVSIYQLRHYAAQRGEPTVLKETDSVRILENRTPQGVAAGADSLKRIALAWGGNDAAIMLDDMDPNDIAPKLFKGAMINAGQAGLAIKRVYAQAALYDELCDELARLAEAATVDDGFNQGAQIGPVQIKMQ